MAAFIDQLQQLGSTLARRLSQCAGHGTASRKRRTQPRFEALEDRLVPSGSPFS
jgi:hypothetical protein